MMYVHGGGDDGKKSVNVYPFSERVSPAVCFPDKKRNKIITMKYLLRKRKKKLCAVRYIPLYVVNTQRDFFLTEDTR